MKEKLNDQTGQNVNISIIKIRNRFNVFGYSKHKGNNGVGNILKRICFKNTTI